VKESFHHGNSKWRLLSKNCQENSSKERCQKFHTKKSPQLYIENREICRKENLQRCLSLQVTRKNTLNLSRKMQMPPQCENERVCKQEAHVGNKAVQWAIQNGMWCCVNYLVNTSTWVLYKLILISIWVRRAWSTWSSLRRLWRSCKGISQSWWRILNETCNSCCGRLGTWRKEEVMFLVFISTPNLQNGQNHQQYFYLTRKYRLKDIMH